MPYKNQYRYANYDSQTNVVNFVNDEAAQFMVGESQKDITVRSYNGEMLRLSKSQQTAEQAVILFAQLLEMRDTAKDC